MSKVSFDNRLMFTYESKSFPGVNKVAALVRQDLYLLVAWVYSPSAHMMPMSGNRKQKHYS